MDKAFKLIDPLLPKQGKNREIFNVLMLEYLDPPIGFTLSRFMARLNIIVTTIGQEITSVPVPSPKPLPVDATDNKIYDLLCSINFDIQTTYFRNIHKSKAVSA